MFMADAIMKEIDDLCSVYRLSEINLSFHELHMKAQVYQQMNATNKSTVNLLEKRYLEIELRAIILFTCIFFSTGCCCMSYKTVHYFPCTSIAFNEITLNFNELLRRSIHFI